jgi:hypothetical protein
MDLGIGSRTGKRSSRLVAAFLTLSILAPLFAAGIAAASESCCLDCPPPVSAAQEAPCHGSLLLSCCDDVATAPEADTNRVESRIISDSRCVVESGGSAPASHVGLRPGPELAWLTSALRRSVVIRT